MYFSLEILQAHHGDCLLLHYGTNANPQLIVIDGGPNTIYDDYLRPRLSQIRENRGSNPLPIAMVMVSHLDDDHINGIVSLFAELREADENGDQQEFTIANLWLNTFDDILGNVQLPKISALPASASSIDVDALNLEGMENADSDTKAVIAATGQGIEVRNAARRLRIEQNFPFKAKQGMAKIVRGDIEESVVDIDNNLTITVLCPSEKRLQSLQKKWDADLTILKQNGKYNAIPSSVVAWDTAAFNVSSIVCVVALGEQRMLLTGDGRTDDTLKGLEEKGLLTADGTIEFDIVKLPHHGSARNIRENFFERVTAKHWVISADGSNDNPDTAVLKFISDHVTEGHIWITNREGEHGLKTKLTKFLNNCSNDVTVHFPENESSLLINLDKVVDF